MTADLFPPVDSVEAIDGRLAAARERWAVAAEAADQDTADAESALIDTLLDQRTEATS